MINCKYWYEVVAKIVPGTNFKKPPATAAEMAGSNVISKHVKRVMFSELR